MKTQNLTNITYEEKLEISEQEFAEIVERHQHSLVRLAFRLVGNVEDAKDLAQWAFAKLWLNRERLDNERITFYYLRKILVNLCIDHLRQQDRQKPDVEFDENKFSSDLSNPQHQLEKQELQKQLLFCIDTLKPKQKATILLRDVEGYSVEETANVLECTKNNVLCNLHLARENVRRKMQRWLANA